MKRALSFSVLLLPVVALACAEEKAPPPEFPLGEDDAVEVTPELAEYGIDPTEYVADEGDPDLAGWPALYGVDGDETDYLVDEDGDPEAPLVPELEEQDNSIALEDQISSVKTTSLGAGAIRILADAPKPSWWTRTFHSPFKVKNDPRNTRGPRNCRGSPYNCFAPNPHADGNRFHPTAAVEQFYAAKKAAESLKNDKKRSAAKKKALAELERTGWPLKPDARMYDGLGTILLTGLKTDSAKVNFGMRREIVIDGKPEVCIYVWKHTDTKSNSASGWVKRSDFVFSPGDDFDRGTQNGYLPRKPDKKDLGGRDVREVEVGIRTAEELGDCASGLSFDATPRCYSKINAEQKQRHGIEQFSELKTVPPKGAGSECAKNCKVGDYLVRKNGVLNLAYATPLVGGLASDTRVVRNGDVFTRIVSDHKKWRFLLRVPLYKPDTSKNERAGSIFFAYGHWGDRYGWMALDALRDPQAKKASLPGSFDCQGKADGFYCVGPSAEQCVGNAAGANVSCADPSKTCVVGADGKATMGADQKPVCQ